MGLSCPILTFYRTVNGSRDSDILETVFDLPVLFWIMSSMSLLFLTILFWLLSRRSKSAHKVTKHLLMKSIWDMIQYLMDKFNYSPGRLFRRYKARLLVILMLFSIFYIHLFYRSMVKTNLVVILKPAIIRSYHDLVNSEARPYWLKEIQIYKIFQSAFNNSIYKQVWNKSLEYGSFRDRKLSFKRTDVSKFINEKDALCDPLIFTRKIIMTICESYEDLLKPRGLKPFLVEKKFSRPLVWYMSHSIPTSLELRINNMIRRLSEAHIIQINRLKGKLHKEPTSTIRECLSTESNSHNKILLEIKNMRILIDLMKFMLFVSITVLIIEMVTGMVVRNQQRSKKKRLKIRKRVIQAEGQH